MKHAVVGYTTSKLQRLMRLVYILELREGKVHHESHNIVQEGDLEVEGGINGDLPLNRKTLESSIHGENLRRGISIAKQPLRFPRHFRVVYMGPQKKLIITMVK